ncbi:long-chain-fatty-acid--CoA ligase [Pseudogracilibacillus sp. SO30301A]|uniref:long-chain-fatty-acid--CoA ligase n=1 Tax=Pseudogracilibacillus sp. SO30301A TaxID=3098291 RepID=UPI00300E515E
MNYPLILPQFLKRAVKLYGDKEAVIGDNIRLTYKEVNARVNQLSCGLIELGVKKGDRVAYLSTNTPEMLEGFFGVLQLGAVLVPLNTRLSIDDLIYIINHSGAKILYADKQFIESILQARDRLTMVESIISNGTVTEETGVIPYNRFLNFYSKEDMDYFHIDENDLATLLYTSGTTGDPKGVMLTHRNNYLHALSSMHHLRVSDEDVLLHVLPMFHVNGWGSPFYYTANGATHVCLDKVRPDLIFEKINKYGVTVIHMAPTVLNSILEYIEKNKVPKQTHRVRIFVAGAAPPLAFIKRVEKELNWKFIQVYGMTETSPLITYSEIRDTQKNLSEEEIFHLKAKTGYELIGSEVKVVNDNGAEVKRDGTEIGEIIVRGIGVMKGYWNDPESTKEKIRDGWLYTGDLAVIYPDNNIAIVDRKKDIIISGGENISSLEVESVIYDHPSIKEAAIVATPHEKWGEVPLALVVKREGYEGTTENEIIAYARARLAHFKAPKKVVFMDALPKNGSGKILKHELRNKFNKVFTT